MSVLAMLLAGAGAVAAGFPKRSGNGVERSFRAALAIALGAGAWSAADAGCRLAFGKPGLPRDILLALAGAALLWAGRRRDPEQGTIREPAPVWLWAVFVLAAAIAAAAFVEHTLRFPDGGWDAWMVWNLRARFLARAADFRTAFSPRMAFLAHQDYPWLLPALVAHGFAQLGDSRAVPAAIAAAFGTLAVAVVTLAVAREHGTRWGALAGLAVLTLPCFATFASNQQSDVPVAVYLSIAAALIVSARSRRELALAGFAAGLAMWTKNEGSLYAACLLAALAWRSRNPWSALAFAAGSLPCAALLLWFKLGFAPPNDLSAFSTPATVVANALDWRRWTELALLSIRRIFYFQDFALWLIAEVWVVGYLFRGRRPSALSTALLLACAAYVPIYVLQPHRLDWIFRTSIDRIVTQLWPAAVLATIPALARTTART